MTSSSAAAPSTPQGGASDGPSIAGVFSQLKSSEKGLSGEEFRQRLRQYGPNALPEKKVNPLL
jgi:H+-transporting ATPase